MVDLRADTASSSDKAEFTETEDRSRTHHKEYALAGPPVAAGYKFTPRSFLGLYIHTYIVSVKKMKNGSF